MPVVLVLSRGIAFNASAEEGLSENVEEQRLEHADYRQTFDTIMLKEGRDASLTDVAETQPRASLPEFLDLAKLRIG